jgi:hypothetical protein
MRLKHLPLVTIVFLFLSILIGITLWCGHYEWEVEVPWFLFEGQRKMLVDFAMVIKIAFVLGTWQNK